MHYCTMLVSTLLNQFVNFHMMALSLQYEANSDLIIFFKPHQLSIKENQPFSV